MHVPPPCLCYFERFVDMQFTDDSEGNSCRLFLISQAKAKRPVAPEMVLLVGIDAIAAVWT